MTKETILIREKLASGQTSSGLEIDPTTIELHNELTDRRWGFGHRSEKELGLEPLM